MPEGAAPPSPRWTRRGRLGRFQAQEKECKEDSSHMSWVCPICESTHLEVVQEGVEGGKVKQKAEDVVVLRCEDCDLDVLGGVCSRTQRLR